MIVNIKTRENIADIMIKQSASHRFAQYSDFALGIIDIIQHNDDADVEISRMICICYRQAGCDGEVRQVF